MLCPRRIEAGPYAHQPSQVEDLRDDDHCAYCGSLNPETFMARLEAGTIELGPTDKNYKVYVRSLNDDKFVQSYRNCPQHPCPDVTDANGKVDVYKCRHWTKRQRNETKFYFRHLSEAQMRRFVVLLNLRQIKFGYPGGFYVAPYFISFGPTPA